MNWNGIMHDWNGIMHDSTNWPMLGLVFGFIGTAVVSALWILLTTNRWWHQRFHVERGINRGFGFCDHCSDAWISRWR